MPDIEIAHLTDRFMRRIQAALNAQAAEFDEHGVGPQGGIILLTLNEIAPARIHELVVRMARDKSQMTRAIKALEAKGLVAREGDAEDGRASILRLTRLGEETVARLQQAVADALDGILAPLDDTERGMLRDLLRMI